MLRILFDEYMPGHCDLFLKVDVMPGFCKVADSYYIPEFLNVVESEKSENVLAYIEYLKTGIREAGVKERFLAFDLSDEYIGGIFLKKGKKGLMASSYAWTKELQGYTVSRKNIDKRVYEVRSSFQIEREFLLSPIHALEGLDWSIDRIKRLS